MSETPRYRTTFFRLLGFLRPYKWSLAPRSCSPSAPRRLAIVAAYLTGDALAHVVAELSDHDRLWLLVVAILVVGLARALLMAGRRLLGPAGARRRVRSP